MRCCLPGGVQDSFGVGEKKCYVLRKEGDFVLPTMRSAMQAIIADNTHLTERCEAMLAALNGPFAAPLEPTYDELNPPKKEYRLTLGDTVYLGAQEYELLAYDKQTVRLYDPTFPIFNKELPREEFDRLLAENPLNDRLLQVAENAAPVADTEEPDTGEPLDAPLSVGRIDFLGTNGSVGESVEYTDAEEFVAAIKEENHAGAPMRIVLYRDGQGQTIPQDFLANWTRRHRASRSLTWRRRSWNGQNGSLTLTVWRSLSRRPTSPTSLMSPWRSAPPATAPTP